MTSRARDFARWLVVAAVAMACRAGPPQEALPPTPVTPSSPWSAPVDPGAAGPRQDAPRARIGTWNLEHFADGKKRGFPENTRGGPTYPPRTDLEYRAIAGIVRDHLRVHALVLQEIHGTPLPEEGGETAARAPASPAHSPELERLAVALGPSYRYAIGASGEAQRIAILFDSSRVRLDGVCEPAMPNERAQGKDLFDRLPLVAHLTLLDGDRPMNDLTLVGVHLASGRDLDKNHDRAMEHLLPALVGLSGQPCAPRGEGDIAILGDFNASRFDDDEERFWGELEAAGWDVLADDAATYPATRLSGHPLALTDGALDYILVTGPPSGLAGGEITSPRATIHTELLAAGPAAFRHSASDHLPVTMEIGVRPDDD